MVLPRPPPCLDFCSFPTPALRACLHPLGSSPIPHPAIRIMHRATAGAARTYARSIDRPRVARSSSSDGSIDRLLLVAAVEGCAALIERVGKFWVAAMRKLGPNSRWIE